MTEEELLKLKAELEAQAVLLKEKEKDIEAKNLDFTTKLTEKDKELASAKELAEKIAKEKLELEELAKSKDSTFEESLAKLKAQQDLNNLTAKIAELEKDNIEKELKLKEKEKVKDEELAKERADKEKALFEAEKNRIIAEKYENKFLVEGVKKAETMAELQSAIKLLDTPELAKASKEDNEAGENVLNGYKPTKGVKKTFLDELNEKLTNKQIRF